MRNGKLCIQESRGTYLKTRKMAPKQRIGGRAHGVVVRKNKSGRNLSLTRRMSKYSIYPPEFGPPARIIVASAAQERRISTAETRRKARSR